MTVVGATSVLGALRAHGGCGRRDLLDTLGSNSAKLRDDVQGDDGVGAVAWEKRE